MGKNALINFTVEEQWRNILTIDLYGVVRRNKDAINLFSMQKRMNEERKFNVTLTATDGGNPPLSSDVIMELELLRQTVKKPIFLQNMYRYGAVILS